MVSVLINDDALGLEKSLLKGCLQGRAKSQEVLYKRYYGYTMSICLSYTNDRDEACEVLNEAFLKVFRNLGKYQRDSPFKSWLRRIVVNTAIDHYRSNRKFKANVDVEQAHLKETGTNIIDQLTAEDILQLLQELPEQYRITFNLYEIEGYSHEEIGEKLGVSVSTSRSNLTRAKKKLREMVTKRFNGAYERSV